MTPRKQEGLRGGTARTRRIYPHRQAGSSGNVKAAFDAPDVTVAEEHISLEYKVVGPIRMDQSMRMLVVIISISSTLPVNHVFYSLHWLSVRFRIDFKLLLFLHLIMASFLPIYQKF